MSAETTCTMCGTDFLTGSDDSGLSIMNQIMESTCPDIANRCAHGDGPLQVARAIYRERTRALYDEPQAQGTEEHEGGVPAVQEPQEAGNEAAGQAEARGQQAGGERQRTVGPSRRKSVPRPITFSVVSCTSCPFNHHLPDDIHVPPPQSGEDGYDVPAGFYCNHPNKRANGRNIIVSVRQIKCAKHKYDATKKCNTFAEWLDSWGDGDFPHTCPLEEPDTSEEPSGHRAVDLG